MADAYLGQVAWGAEQEWCCLDPKQNYSQVAWIDFLKSFFGQRISAFCDRLGLEINDESSIYYWAAKWAQWNIGPHTTATIYSLAIAGTTSQWFLPLWRMEVLETCSSFTPLKIQVPFLSYVWGHWQYSTFRLGGRHPWGPKTYQQAGNEKRQHRFHQFDLSLDSTAVAAHN